MRTTFALALALIAVGVGSALAQQGPVTARATLDRSAMAIGDQALLTVTVDLAPGYDLLATGVPRAIGDFEVADTLTALQTRDPAGVTRLQLRYLVTAFELGPHVLPVIAVGYRGPDGTEGEARTERPLLIEIGSVVQPGEDTTDIKPLKPPLPVPGATNELLERVVPFAATALLLLTAAVLALRIRRRGVPLGQGSLSGPARRALEELERVAELRLAERGRTREHYDLVSAALRRYVVERYGLAADAHTARELRRDLERGGVDRTQAQVVFEILADAEAIRYEERPISPARAQKEMRDVIEIMRRSVIAEEYDLASSGISG